MLELLEEEIQIKTQTLPSDLPSFEEGQNIPNIEDILSGECFKEVEECFQHVPEHELSSYQYGIIMKMFPVMSTSSERSIFEELEKSNERLSETDDEKDKQQISYGIQNLRRFIIYSNLKAVCWLYRKYGKSLTFPDGMQAGEEGLIHAINRFDLSCEGKFLTYAKYWIQRCIQVENARNLSIRLSYRKTEKISQMLRFLINKEQELSKEFSKQEERSILLEEGFNEKDIDLFQSWVNCKVISLDNPNPENDIDLEDKIPLEEETPMEAIDPTLNEKEVRELIFNRNLTKQQMIVVFLAFGFYDGNPYDMKFIAKTLGCVRQNVYDILDRAIYKLAQKNPPKPKYYHKAFSSPEEVIEYISSSYTFPKKIHQQKYSRKV